MESARDDLADYRLRNPERCERNGRIAADPDNPEPMRRSILPRLLSSATGTLVCAAFLGMTPMAFEGAGGLATSATVLAGMVAFFGLGRIVPWHHCHERECKV